MLVSIILFVTAAIGFLCTAFIFGENKNQEHSSINKYLIIIIAVNAVRLLFHGISQAYPEIEISKLVNIIDVGITMLMPCSFLYFENLVYENKFELRNLLHFIVPILLGILSTAAFFLVRKRQICLKKSFSLS